MGGKILDSEYYANIAREGFRGKRGHARAIDKLVWRHAEGAGVKKEMEMAPFTSA